MGHLLLRVAQLPMPMFSFHLYRMLRGACDPMLCPVHGFRPKVYLPPDKTCIGIYVEKVEAGEPITTRRKRKSKSSGRNDAAKTASPIADPSSNGGRAAKSHKAVAGNSTPHVPHVHTPTNGLQQP